MRGLSEEDIKQFIRKHNLDYEHKEIAGSLLEECHEFDPWLSIDENIPNDEPKLSLSINECKKFSIGNIDEC